MHSTEQYFLQYEEDLKDTLSGFFRNALTQAAEIHPSYRTLWEELERVTLNGGKRLRPKMMLLTYDACGGKDIEAVIPAAAALELLHSSLLIHDDIIDRELIRRGNPNVSGAYYQAHYTTLSASTERRHYSDAAALLGGDLLLTGSFQLIDSCKLPSLQLNAAKRVIHRVILEVAGGQLLDSEAAFAREHASVEAIARYKTASYSFIGPLLVGAALAGTGKETQDKLETFATNLGIAYQLHDDVLGVFGDENKTGKSTSSDLREGKLTYPVEYFMQQANEEQKASFMHSFGNPGLTAKDAQRLLSLFVENNALEATESQIDHYVKQARQALEGLAYPDEVQAKFEWLIDASVRRTA